jgi:hypothetical protein
MRIKTSVGMVVFGCSFIIYLICLWINWLQRFDQNFLAGGNSMGMPTMYQVADVNSGVVRWSTPIWWLTSFRGVYHSLKGRDLGGGAAQLAGNHGELYVGLSHLLEVGWIGMING